MRRITSGVALQELLPGNYVVVFDEDGKFKDFWLVEEGARIKSMYEVATGRHCVIDIADFLCAITEELEQRAFIFKCTHLLLNRMKLPKDQILNFGEGQLMRNLDQMDSRFMTVENTPRFGWNDALTLEAFMDLPPGTPILIHDKEKGLVSLNFKWENASANEIRLDPRFGRWVMWYDESDKEIRFSRMTETSGILDHVAPHLFFEMYDVSAILTAGALEKFLEAFMAYLFQLVYAGETNPVQTPFCYPPHLMLDRWRPPAPGTVKSSAADKELVRQHMARIDEQRAAYWKIANERLAEELLAEELPAEDLLDE
jgi:hypothetical protein